MSEPRLNALRRNELVQVLKDMLSATKNPADVESWIDPVFMAVTLPPPVVAHAAVMLERWNCYGNSPNSYQGNVRFLPPEEGYETIAEIVLATANTFNKANEEDSVGAQALVHVPLAFDDLIDRVEEALRFINNTIGSNAADNQVASLRVAVDMLIKLRDNYLLVPKSE